jgi:hypothetical protein
MERQARAAGARFEVRDGWNVARVLRTDGAGDAGPTCSHLRKLEVHGRHELRSGTASQATGRGGAVHARLARSC